MIPINQTAPTQVFWEFDPNLPRYEDGTAAAVQSMFILPLLLGQEFQHFDEMMDGADGLARFMRAAAFARQLMEGG